MDVPGGDQGRPVDALHTGRSQVCNMMLMGTGASAIASTVALITSSLFSRPSVAFCPRWDPSCWSWPSLPARRLPYGSQRCPTCPRRRTRGGGGERACCDGHIGRRQARACIEVFHPSLNLPSTPPRGLAALSVRVVVRPHPTRPTPFLTARASCCPGCLRRILLTAYCMACVC